VTATPILELCDITRTYGAGDTTVMALRGVSLQVAAGEFVAVMGPSGGGKSTLLNIAGGLDQPDEGEVWVGGARLTALSPTQLAAVRRRSTGYIFQERNLLPSLTAIENVALPLELDGIRSRDARTKALSALDQVGVAEMAGRLPAALSGGQQQLVAIARAIVGQRRLLLADEPTGALDSRTGEKVLQVLKKRCEAGTALLLVTHEARHAGWADRVIFLRDGELIDDTKPVTPPVTLTEVGR
jgi:putative ABC transport system ATP-binding protein